MRKKTTRSNGRGKFAEPLVVPVTEDDLDAMKLVSAILGQFGPEDRERIMRYVAEKFGIGQPSIIASSSAPAPVREAVQHAPRIVRNPHEMAKPPLNKLIVQEDDDEGIILGVPQDANLPEPPEAELKPKGPAKRLVTVEDVHKGKDGREVKSRSLLMVS